ncbi:nucleic acid-binding, OB-fold protein [Tanacetum coccineum]
MLMSSASAFHALSIPVLGFVGFVPNITQNCIFDLSPGARDKILEVRVYRKWINRKRRKQAPTDYRCILIYIEGNAIQANMDAKDISYLNSLLQYGSAYRILNFLCMCTSIYQQTLDTQTTLRFGRLTKFDNIPAEGFQSHYSNFVAYNQLEYKLNREDNPIAQNQQTLTDYIGCLTRVTDVQKFGSAGENQVILRKLDIENLSGNVVELTLWDEMAINFQKAEFDLMQKLVIIDVKLGQLLAEFTTKYNLKPPLEICKTKYEDPHKEKSRNKYPLSTLLQENLDSYKRVIFTTKATISRINTTRDWYYVSCSKCINKVIDGDNIPTCADHGPQPNPAYRYNYKAYITDHSATTTFTFFTPNANVLTGSDCSNLVKKIHDTRDFPTEILAIEGRRHIFQFHYNPYCETGRVDFYFDDILDKPLQIKDAPTTTPQLTGESSKALAAKPTLELAAPLTPVSSIPVPIQITATPADPSAVEKITSAGHPDETQKEKIESAKSLKRELFYTKPAKQKKNKLE